MSPPPSTASPAREPARWPQRVPAPMILLGVPSILIGVFGALLSMSTITESLLERRTAVERTRDAAVKLLQGGSLASPRGDTADVSALAHLPPVEAQRVSALVADELYERRGALVPLALMNLILCWLLVTGALGALRRRDFGVSMWRWAALGSIPLAGLSLLVTSVRVRAVVGATGPAIAAAMAAVSKRPADTELAALKALTQGYLGLLGLWYAVTAFLFALTALYLRRAVPDDERHISTSA